jgi:copper chaperone
MRFDVQDMHCGHCVGSITRAVQALDPAARVTAEIEVRRIEVASEVLAPPQVVEAIATAGYAARALA